MGEITVDEILSEWSARVGRIGSGALPAWRRILANREVIRDYSLAMDAVRAVAAEVERGQHRRTPGLTHFEQTYKNQLLRFERERYEDDKPEGCASCRKSGLVAMVIAYSPTRERLCPVKRNQVPYCKGEAFRMYIPCTCAKGWVINMEKQGTPAGPPYSRDILDRLHRSCAWESNFAADEHMMKCRQVPEPKETE